MKKRFVIPMVMTIGFSSVNAGTMGSVEPEYNFSGFFVGLGTGVTTIFTKDLFLTTRSDGLGGNSDSNHYTNTSILFTGNIGYGAMISPKAYLGAKSSLYYTPINHLTETGFSTSAGSTLIVGNNSITTSLKPIYNIDVVLGFEVAPHLLPFAEAGVTFADENRGYTFKRSRTNIATLANVKYESGLRLNSYKSGYNVGVGINYQPQKNWFFSSELVYSDLGKNSSSVTVAIPSTSTTETQSRAIRNSSVALLCGINFLFNT